MEQQQQQQQKYSLFYDPAQKKMESIFELTTLSSTKQVRFQKRRSIDKFTHTVLTTVCLLRELCKYNYYFFV